MIEDPNIIEVADKVESSKERDYAVIFLAVISYILIGLIVYRVLAWMGMENTEEGEGPFDRLKEGFDFLRNYVIIMGSIGIFSGFLFGWLGYNNLRKGFLFCGVGVFLMYFLLMI